MPIFKIYAERREYCAPISSFPPKEPIQIFVLGAFIQKHVFP